MNFFQVFMTTSSIHEMLSTELTKLGVFDLDKNQFTKWSEEKSHKTMLPGMFSFYLKYSPLPSPPPPPTELTKLGVFDLDKNQFTKWSEETSHKTMLPGMFSFYLKYSPSPPTELTKLGVFDLDKNQFTTWSEEKSHKTMLPGMFSFYLKYSPSPSPPPPPRSWPNLACLILIRTSLPSGVKRKVTRPCYLGCSLFTWNIPPPLSPPPQELTKLGVFDLDKNQFTKWSEETSHKTMLPGRFSYYPKYSPPPPLLPPLHRADQTWRVWSW